MAIIVNWNGVDVPEELKGLKKGRYVLLPMDEAPELTETYGKQFEKLYEQYEEMADKGEMKLTKRVQARVLWKKMLGMLFEVVINAFGKLLQCFGFHLGFSCL